MFMRVCNALCCNFHKWDLGLVILSMYRSIFCNVEDHETQNKTHIDIKYEREENDDSSVSVLSC